MALTINLDAGLRPPPPPDSGTPDNRLVFQRKIGQGGEGIVYAAVPSERTVGTKACRRGCAGDPRRLVAVKVITGQAFERCRATHHLWASLVHPNVVYPRSACFDDTNARCFVEMELLSTDLLDHVLSEGPLEDSKASEIAGHLASALNHLHLRGVAHRDVKLENIFVQDGVAKLGDLGSIVHIQRLDVTRVPSCSSEDFDDRFPTTAASPPAEEIEGLVGGANVSAAAVAAREEFVGSTLYAPPESVHKGCSGSGGGTTCQDPIAGDMWSLGVTLYGAVAGFHPWKVANETSKEFRQFLGEGLTAILPKSFSPGLKSLLRRLLVLDPSQRATAAQVLADPWVTRPPASLPTSFSPVISMVPTTMGPVTITPPGTQISAERGASGMTEETAEVVPVEASPNSAVKRRGFCSIAAVTHPALIITAAEAGGGSARCRKRKKPEGDDDRHLLVEDNAEVKMGGLQGPVDESGNVEKQPSSLARVGAPSSRTTTKYPVESITHLRHKKRRRADSAAITTPCFVQGSGDVHEPEDSQRRLFDMACFEVSNRRSGACPDELATRPPSAAIAYSLEEQLMRGSSIL